jgi:hypothetical protein
MNIRGSKRGASDAPQTSSKAVGFPVGKLLVSSAALLPAVGAFMADWNTTHVYNPTWPPHAKFHNAQTITLAVEAAGLSLWQLWGPGQESLSRLRWATLCAGLFWLTQAPAIFFPGTAFVDPDNPTQPTSLAGIPINQVTALAAILLPLLAAGYAMEARRLRRAS